jgi:hypothetical protein
MYYTVIKNFGFLQSTPEEKNYGNFDVLNFARNFVLKNTSETLCFQPETSGFHSKISEFHPEISGFLPEISCFQTDLPKLRV